MSNRLWKMSIDSICRPDLFPLDPPDRSPASAYRERLLEQVADDVEVFARATGLLVTDANRDLVDYLWGTFLHAEGADEPLRRELVRCVDAWIEGQL